MIITSICLWKPVIIPYNDWLLVKEIIDNNLWITYENWKIDDLKNKVKFFMTNQLIVKEYSKRCLEYSKINYDVNKFINFIFEELFCKE
jgi:glycosyltransferase involved in cell wall biosynthesis